MVDNRIEFDTGLEFSQAEVRDPPLPLPPPPSPAGYNYVCIHLLNPTYSRLPPK